MLEHKLPWSRYLSLTLEIDSDWNCEGSKSIETHLKVFFASYVLIITTKGRMETISNFINYQVSVCIDLRILELPNKYHTQAFD